MALSTWGLVRTSWTLWEGDSLSDPAFPYQMLAPIVLASRANYYGGATSVREPHAQTSYDGSLPIWVNKAVNGSQLSTINARITAELAANPYTHVALCVGTNQRTIARATTQADFVTLMDTATANGRKVLVVGPCCWGEKYPSGQNDGDTGHAWDAVLDNTSADMKIIVNGGTTTDSVTYPGYANAIFVDLRTTVYAVNEPLVNTPAPGAFIGPYTTPDASGAHYSSTGRAAVNVEIAKAVSYS